MLGTPRRDADPLGSITHDDWSCPRDPAAVVRDRRPQPIFVRLTFVSSNRTCPLRERKPLTSARDCGHFSRTPGLTSTSWVRPEVANIRSHFSRTKQTTVHGDHQVRQNIRHPASRSVAVESRTLTRNIRRSARRTARDSAVHRCYRSGRSARRQTQRPNARPKLMSE